MMMPMMMLMRKFGLVICNCLHVRLLQLDEGGINESSSQAAVHRLTYICMVDMRF